MNPQKLFCLCVWDPPILSIQEYFGCIKKEKLYPIHVLRCCAKRGMFNALTGHFFGKKHAVVQQKRGNKTSNPTANCGVWCLPLSPLLYYTTTTSSIHSSSAVPYFFIYTKNMCVYVYDMQSRHRMYRVRKIHISATCGASDGPC